MYRIFTTIGLIWLLSLLLSGCSEDPANPEERLRQTIAEAEALLQARELSDALDYVHPDYQDKHGRDVRQLRALLTGYFLRHKSIHILSRIEQIDLTEDGGAHVLLFAGLAGSPQEGAVSLDQWRGDLLRLQLDFVQNGEQEWLLRQAGWRRARPDDFIR